MFDIIKIVIELVINSLNIQELLKRKSKKKIRKIGTELFLFYTSINDIIVYGRYILNLLNSSISLMERQLKLGNKDYICSETDFPDLIHLQLGNIKKLCRSLEVIGRELQLISTEAFIKLIPLIHHKLGTLWQIASILRFENIPLDPSAQKEISKLQFQYKKKLFECKFEKSIYEIFDELNTGMLSDHPIYDLLTDELITIRKRMEINSIINPSNLTKKQYLRLKEYLTNFNPSKTLDEMARIANKLRKAIISNFSIEDILLEIEDERTILPL